MKFRTRIAILKDDILRVYPERFMIWLAWKLPAKFVLWCFIRVVAHTETGSPSDWYKEVHDNFYLAHIRK